MSAPGHDSAHSASQHPLFPSSPISLPESTRADSDKRCRDIGLRALDEPILTRASRNVLEWLNIIPRTRQEFSFPREVSSTSESDLDFFLELDDQSTASLASKKSLIQKSEQGEEMWPALLRQTASWFLTGQLPDAREKTIWQIRGDESVERQRLLNCYPALLPLTAQTHCDLPCSPKHIPLLCEFAQIRTFSVENWLSYHDLSEMQQREIYSPLLKIKICHLLREVQQDLDQGQFLSASPILERQFGSIPDELAIIYAPGQNSFSYHNLLKIVSAFVDEYRVSKRVSAATLMPLISRYICQVYHERELLEGSKNLLHPPERELKVEPESPKAIACPSSSGQTRKRWL